MKGDLGFTKLSSKFKLFSELADKKFHCVNITFCICCVAAKAFYIAGSLTRLERTETHLMNLGIVYHASLSLSPCLILAPPEVKPEFTQQVKGAFLFFAPRLSWEGKRARESGGKSGEARFTMN